MKTTRIDEFKDKLQDLLREYNVIISTAKRKGLIEYTAVTFIVDGNMYWAVDEDGYAACMINDSDVLNLMLK